MNKFLLILLLLVFQMQNGFSIPKSNNFLLRCNKKLIEIVMEDLFNPPVASRVYVYPNIAAYEVLAMSNPKLRSLYGQISHLPKLISPTLQNYNASIAAEFAFTTVAKKIIFSEYMINDFEKTESDIWQQKINDSNMLETSIAVGRNIGKQLIDWIIKDNYIQIKTMERYVLKEKKGAWKPTAPEYINGLEPNWPKMRPLIMSSADQIKCAPMPIYNETKTSESYKNMLQVFETANHLDTTQKWIAQFWDCNPNISYAKGHITYFVHKVSPGGHWMNIASQACENLSLSEAQTTEIFTMLTIGLYDGFLSCWAEKYRYNSIRPETYIQSKLDINFRPYLQTPPFPEYPSGHSVISNTAAVILTKYIPQPYSFTDSSEMYFDIPPRTFSSFSAAAKEAGISRFYGGIHFMPALINGSEQGNKIGKLVLQKIKTKK
jgi:PAP2 superfamily